MTLSASDSYFPHDASLGRVLDELIIEANDIDVIIAGNAFVHAMKTLCIPRAQSRGDEAKNVFAEVGVVHAIGCADEHKGSYDAVGEDLLYGGLQHVKGWRLDAGNRRCCAGTG